MSVLENRFTIISEIPNAGGPKIKCVQILNGKGGKRKNLMQAPTKKTLAFLWFSVHFCCKKCLGKKNSS